MKNTELETFVKLKYFPHKGTKEYLHSLPLCVARDLYYEIYETDWREELESIMERRLLFILSSGVDQHWNEQVIKILTKLLIEYEKQRT